jgi:hypothetical protein
LRRRTGTSSNISVLDFPDVFLAAIIAFPATANLYPAASNAAGA